MAEHAGDRTRSPLAELTLVRLRELAREPEAVFWVFIFPVLLAAILGLAFRSRPPEALPGAAGRGRGVAERRGAGGRLHRRARGADRAGHALRRFPGAGPARHEPHGHRHLGDRVLARGGAPGQPAEAPRRVARAAQSHPGSAALVALDLPRPRGRGPAPVRLAGPRRPRAGLAPAAHG